MSLILRIDVDRPYGRKGIIRHFASRISSDYFLPRMAWLRYLDELKAILRTLNHERKSAYVFYRKCTLPSPGVLELMKQGHHVSGLHLENSRTFESFRGELSLLEGHLMTRVETFSKHGSGRYRYGWNHYAPYEPEKYLAWAKKAGMKVFFGNLDDPAIEPIQDGPLLYFPSAFWLEPYWRDTKRFPIEWLLSEARKRDVVMLLHPENAASRREIMNEFLMAVDNLEVKLV